MGDNLVIPRQKGKDEMKTKNLTAGNRIKVITDKLYEPQMERRNPKLS